MALLKIKIKENYNQQELELNKGQEFIIISRNNLPKIYDGKLIKDEIEWKYKIVLDKDKWSYEDYLEIEVLSDSLENLEKEVSLIKEQKIECSELGYYEKASALRDYEKEINNKILKIIENEELIYNQFSANYDKIYLENILEFRKNIAKNTNDWFIHFYPSFGINRNEKSDFLIYGQAVKGGPNYFDILNDEVTNLDTLKARYNSNTFLKANDNNPIDVVNAYWNKDLYFENCEKDIQFKNYYTPINYNYCKSFFWNVIFKLVSQYYNYNEHTWEWSKKIVWSNLYKIARENDNPNISEISAQLEKSIELVKLELEEVKPKFCIIITNLKHWLPFQEVLKTTIIYRNNDEKVQSIEEYNGTKIIVTSRPYPNGDSNAYVAEILNLIKNQE